MMYQGKEFNALKDEHLFRRWNNYLGRHMHNTHHVTEGSSADQDAWDFAHWISSQEITVVA